jgi:hypothetical protein
LGVGWRRVDRTGEKLDHTGQAAANQATYDNQKRLFMADIVIFFALLMILFDKHPFSSE